MNKVLSIEQLNNSDYKITDSYFAYTRSSIMDTHYAKCLESLSKDILNKSSDVIHTYTAEEIIDKLPKSIDLEGVEDDIYTAFLYLDITDDNEYELGYGEEFICRSESLLEAAWELLNKLYNSEYKDFIK